MIAARGVLCPFKDPGRCLLFDEHKDSASKPLIWVRELLFVCAEDVSAMAFMQQSSFQEYGGNYRLPVWDLLRL